MSMNQAITRHSTTTALTFVNKPSDETRSKLLAAGYQFDGKSKQWFRHDAESHVVGEEVVAKQLAA
jgi:hypothetical protein